MTRLITLILTCLPLLNLAAADGPSGTGTTTTGGGQTTGEGGGGSSSPAMLIMLPLIFGLMYFIVIRPQRREEKRRKALIEALKRGDQVITIGGIHGEVVAIGEGTVDIKVGLDGNGTVLRFNRGSVSQTVDETKVGKGN